MDSVAAVAGNGRFSSVGYAVGGVRTESVCRFGSDFRWREGLQHLSCAEICISLSGQITKDV